MNPTASPGAPRRAEEPNHLDILRGTAYRATRELGQGSMGLVVEAEHLALGTMFVVKLLHQALAERPDFVDRMRIEAQSLARLRHPNLVTVTDFSVTPAGIPFLVMERLAGHTIAEERRLRRAFPLEEAIDMARQTLAGLAVVHEAGIVHRDIKAGNLFLCDGPPGRRTVKLLDFGIAKVLASAPRGRAPQPLRYPTAEGVTIGTPRCLSPEQARGLVVDARTDLYAVGVLLYTLLVGVGPFDHLRTSIDLLHAHIHLVPVPPSQRAFQSIPPEIDAAVMRALAKRPDDRFANAVEFSAALARALDAMQDRFDTDPSPPRFDTEPLPSVAGAAFEVTQWIPPVPPLEARESEPTTMTRLDAVAARPNLLSPTALTPGLGLSVLVVMLSAFLSAGTAAFLAWEWLHR